MICVRTVCKFDRMHVRLHVIINETLSESNTELTFQPTSDTQKKNNNNNINKHCSMTLINMTFSLFGRKYTHRVHALYMFTKYIVSLLHLYVVVIIGATRSRHLYCNPRNVYTSPPTAGHTRPISRALRHTMNTLLHHESSWPYLFTSIRWKFETGNDRTPMPEV